jgi:aspartate dehydrogenase
MRLGLIGHGAIADTLLQGLSADRAHLDELVCLAKPPSFARAERLLQRHHALGMNRRVVGSCRELTASGIDLAVECAGHEALHSVADSILGAGIDLIPASLGAFADEEFHARLLATAVRSGAKLYLPAGAIGGLDILGAARLAGMQEIMYVSRKPPMAWRDTPAERHLDLAHLDAEATFFEGTAREAARDYPKNANVAAALALAGIGFDRTHVRLVADPRVERNVHEVTMRSACADLVLRIEGRTSESNPKTSLTAGYSIARLVLNRMTHEVI